MCLLGSWEMLEKAFQDFRILPGAKEMCQVGVVDFFVANKFGAEQGN